jgi:hypothetical protein
MPWRVRAIYKGYFGAAFEFYKQQSLKRQATTAIKASILQANGLSNMYNLKRTIF